MSPQEFQTWVAAQMALTKPGWAWGRWEVVCPACGDLLYRRARKPFALMTALEQHLLSDPPFGLEHRQRAIGDRLTLNGELYKVAEIFRPYSNRYYHKVRAHTFQLALRRVRDGKLYRTSATQAGVVEPLARSQRKEFGL